MLKSSNSKLLILFATFLFLFNYCGNNSADYPFQNSDLAIDERVNDLVGRMTLDEKISQMQNASEAIPRLGIPEYNWWNECLHGVARNGVATVFPQAIGMAATWDPDLIKKEADVISTEARAKYKEAQLNNERKIYQGLTFWSPNINIFRDPRWGRGQETYGEDPFLTSKIGIAFVQGLQGDDPDYYKVIATAKHYAVHSGPETERHGFDVDVSDRDLYETYLYAFEQLVKKGGVYSIMGAYNAFRGDPCCMNPFLLEDVLRNKWGFNGYIVSDCGAIMDIVSGHKKLSTLTEASAAAVKAGCDLTCGGEYSYLHEALENGLITEEQIDVSVKRLMKARFKLGLFDSSDKVKWAQISEKDYNTDENLQMALNVARESVVLLKNESNLLPLKTNLKSIAVIGPYADYLDVLLGNYNGDPTSPVTFLQGIKNRTPEGTSVRYAKGVDMIEKGTVFQVVNKKYLKPAGGNSGNGLFDEYFDNPDLKGKPVFTKVESSGRLYWGVETPGEGIPKDHFSVRRTGYLIPDQDGVYELGLIADDKCRLYLNDNLKIDNWNPFETNKMKSFKVDLKAGKEYKIRIEYADETEYAGVRFMWRKMHQKGQDDLLIEEAVKLAGKSDVAIIVAGISPRLEGEEMPVKIDGFYGGDRTSLKIPAGMSKLIREVYKTGKPVVLVLTSGSALAINWEKENIPAILQAWYPGQEGGNAVADVLFGNYNPAGRLPVTYYKSVDDLPAFRNYDMEGRTYKYFRGKTLFPFGYGLSYSVFTYNKVSLTKDELSAGDTIRIKITIGNIGDMDGDEVVQVYFRSRNAGKEAANKKLIEFKRVHFQSGESKTIGLNIPVNALAGYDAKSGEMVPLPGDYVLEIGASSEDIRAELELKIVN